MKDEKEGYGHNIGWHICCGTLTLPELGSINYVF